MLDSVRLLKHGGIVSCYGMTALGTVAVPMTAVLKNIEFRGSFTFCLPFFRVWLYLHCVART